MNQQHFHNWKKIRQPFFISLAGILAVIFIFAGLSQNIRHLFSAKREINQIKQEVDRLEKKNQDIEKIVEYLDSKEFIEEEARLKFDLKKPNEQIIVVQKATIATNTIGLASSSIFDLPAPKEAREPLSHNPKQWFNYFFAKK
ncbi:MAG TPA: septum formation initiator family protein [bacterium]|nr:septum formation initiator family protein [bacterium]